MTENNKIKVIKGIGVLSILSDKENETLKNIDTIKNTGVIIAREDFYSKYPNITLKGIGNIILVPCGGNVTFGMGVTTIDQSYLDAVEKKQHIVSLGAIVISPDTDAKTFTQKISGISIMGTVICPERLVGAVSSLLKSSMNLTIPYPNDSNATAKAENGNMVINAEYLESLKENTVFITNGNLTATEPLKKQLAEKKILHLLVNGTFTVSQENQDILASKTTVNGTTIVVPSGYEYVKSDLKLNENNISDFNGKKVFAKKTVIFEKALTSEMIAGSSLSLMCSAAIYNKSVEKAVNSILTNPDTKKIIYEDEILINRNVRKITLKELQYSKARLDLLNYGDMELSEEIDDETFIGKISGIHNYGKLRCSDELYGLVQSKVIEDEGMISTFEDTAEKKESNEIVVMSGLGNLEL